MTSRTPRVRPLIARGTQTMFLVTRFVCSPTSRKIRLSCSALLTMMLSPEAATSPAMLFPRGTRICFRISFRWSVETLKYNSFVSSSMSRSELDSECSIRFASSMMMFSVS